MDRKLSQSQEIERLIRLGEVSRSRLGGEVASLKQRLDIPMRIHGSLKQHPTGWLLGALASGLVASLLFRRKTVVREKKHRSFPLALLGLTLTAVRPFAKVWLTDQVKNYLVGQRSSPPASRTYSGQSHP